MNMRVISVERESRHMTQPEGNNDFSVLLIGLFDCSKHWKLNLMLNVSFYILEVGCTQQKLWIHCAGCIATRKFSAPEW